MTPEQWQEAIDTQLARLDWMGAEDKAALRFVMLEMLPRWNAFLIGGFALSEDSTRAHTHRVAATSCLADMVRMLGRYSAIIDDGDPQKHTAMVLSWIAGLVEPDHQPQGPMH